MSDNSELYAEPPTSPEEAAIIKELDQDDVQTEQLTDAQIEEKYLNNQSRLFIQRNDFLVLNLLDMFKQDGVLDLTPAYQRRTRWDTTKRSHLIESLLMNVPIPPIFLYETVLAKYEVMDGQQRLSTIRAFYNNEFKLTHLKMWPELNGLTYKNLPPKIQSGLLRRGLSAVIILTESSPSDEKALELRQYVFERLNTGGEKLNAQEVRNCIYASNFNEMLVQASRSDAFTTAWGIPAKETGEPQKVSKKLQRSTLFRKMLDCEIVLRYFALSDLDHMRGGMKLTLDRYMMQMKSASLDQCDTLCSEYVSVLESALSVYGKSLFRIPDAHQQLNGRRSVTLSDAILLGFRAHLDHRAQLIKNREQLVKDTAVFLRDKETLNLFIGAGNTKSIFEQRIRAMTEFLAKYAVD